MLFPTCGKVIECTLCVALNLGYINTCHEYNLSWMSL